MQVLEKVDSGTLTINIKILTIKEAGHQFEFVPSGPQLFFFESYVTNNMKDYDIQKEIGLVELFKSYVTNDKKDYDTEKEIGLADFSKVKSQETRMIRQ